MAFNIIPKSPTELENISYTELLDFYNFIVKEYKITDPFAFEREGVKEDSPNKTTNVNVKIMWALQFERKIHNFIKKIDDEYKEKVKEYKKAKGKSEQPPPKYNFIFKWGNGSRGEVVGSTSNKGNIFESQLFKEFKDFIKDGDKKTQTIEDILKFFPSDGYLIEKVVAEGAKDQKRPLDFSGDYITAGKKRSNWDIGSTITDITLEITNAKNEKDKKKIYLSLKYGDKVSFASLGIRKYLPIEDIKNEHIKGNGVKLLDLFNIDHQKFCTVFNNYVKRNISPKEKITEKEITVDVRSHLNSNKYFKELIRSVIGYGFILVHKEKSKVHVIEMTKEKLERMINVKSAKIRYPLDGTKKRVDCFIELTGLDITIVFRSKVGGNAETGIYPSHLAIDYVMDHNAIKNL